MLILYALLLGIVQGITEFLPISSSGHLMLLENIFDIGSGGLFFNVLVHFATLIAVVLVLWKDVAYIVKHPFSHETGMILTACVPTFVTALLVRFFVSDMFMIAFLGFGFLISALVIMLTSILAKRRALLQPLNFWRAMVIGITQGLAVFPGVSRSGSTICAALLCGVERERAARFSFLISIPVILGGMVFEVAEGIKCGFGNINVWFCIVGFLAAFVVALVSVKIMLKIVKSGKLWPFCIYLFLLAVLVILNQFVLYWF